MINLFRRPKLFFKANASTLLTFIGAGGVVFTSVLAVKATPKAMKLLEHAKEEKGDDLTVLETVKTAGPAYIPAVVSGTSTIACIFGANVLNKRQQAALTSAYALLDTSYKRYRAKVNELYGPAADIRVRDAIVKEEASTKEAPSYDGLRLFYDSLTMRYFETTVDSLRRAEQELNAKLLTTGYASVNDLCDFIGIARVDFGDRLGWTAFDRGRISGCTNIEFCHHKVELEDGLICCMIDTVTEPSFDYLDY